MNPVRAVFGTLLTTALDAALLALALGGITPLPSHRRALALLAIWATGSLVLGIARPVRRHDPVEETRPQLPMMLALLLIPMAVPPLSAWTEAHDLWTVDRFPFKWAAYFSRMHHHHHAKFTGGNFATITLLYDWMFGTLDHGEGGKSKPGVS